MKVNGKVFFLLLTFAATLTGCGFMETQTNIDQGMKAVNELHYDTASTHFETAILEEEDKELSFRGLGLASMGKAEYEKAAEYFTLSLQESSFFPTNLAYDTNYYLASAYFNQEDYEKAVSTYDGILALRKKEPKAYFLRAYALLTMGNYEKAIEDFNQAVELSPKDYEMQIDIFLKLKEEGYKEEGVKYLSAAIHNQDKSMTNFDKGRICYYLEDYENARTYLEEARDEENADTILMLGQTYEALTDFNYAASVYNSYLLLHPSAKVYNQLGLCKIHLNDYQGALEAFQEGIKLNDKDMMQALSYNEIVAYEYLTDFKKAASLMEAYISMYPQDEKALREYEFLKTR